MFCKECELAEFFRSSCTCFSFLRQTMESLQILLLAFSKSVFLSCFYQCEGRIELSEFLTEVLSCFGTVDNTFTKCFGLLRCLLLEFRITYTGWNTNRPHRGDKGGCGGHTDFLAFIFQGLLQCLRIAHTAVVVIVIHSHPEGAVLFQDKILCREVCDLGKDLFRHFYTGACKKVSSESRERIEHMPGFDSVVDLIEGEVLEEGLS